MTHNLDTVPDELLGASLKEYLESSDDMDWEGWSEHEQVIVQKFLTDLALAIKCFKDLS